jgi:hypothetical protein
VSWWAAVATWLFLIGLTLVADAYWPQSHGVAVRLFWGVTLIAVAVGVVVNWWERTR